MPNSSSRGDYKIMVRTYTLSDLKVYAIGWCDNRPVHALCTFDTPISKVQRNVKVGGVYKRIEISRPQCISYYNDHMNGINICLM